MKKVLLGLTVSLSLTVARGQTAIYHPFPDSNAIWTWQWCVTSPQPMCGSNAYFLNGDTTVSSTTYHKLCYYPGQNIVIGGIRNDTVFKKTYFICFNPTYNPNCSSHITEKILYDFSAGIGDTVFYGVCGINWQVNSIDSIQLLDGTYRKTFKCNWGDVIEGIGNNGNLICGTQDGLAYLGLLCFQKDGTTFYSSPPSIYNSNPNPCLIVGVKEQNATFGLTISPHPFSAQTVLQTNISLQNATLTVDNCFGQTVAQIKNLRGQTIIFNRDNLASGLYFVRLSEENKTIAVDKLVIADR